MLHAFVSAITEWKEHINLVVVLIGEVEHKVETGHIVAMHQIFRCDFGFGELQSQVDSIDIQKEHSGQMTIFDTACTIEADEFGLRAEEEVQLHVLIANRL